MQNRRVEIVTAVGRKDSAVGRNTIGSNVRGRVSHTDGVKCSDRVGSYIGARIGENKGVLAGHVNGICKISS